MFNKIFKKLLHEKMRCKSQDHEEKCKEKYEHFTMYKLFKESVSSRINLQFFRI
jgi:hypothetical protein